MLGGFARNGLQVKIKKYHVVRQDMSLKMGITAEWKTKLHQSSSDWLDIVIKVFLRKFVLWMPSAFDCTISCMVDTMIHIHVSKYINIIAA